MANKKTLRARLRLNGWRLWVLLTVLLYTLAGFFLAPLLIEKKIVEFGREGMGVDVQIEKVRVNPYLLSVSLEGFSSSDPEMGPLLSFDQFLVDFQTSSLFRWAWTFRMVHFDNFHFRPKRLENGVFSSKVLMDRLAASQPESEPEPSADESSPLRLIIQTIEITSGKIEFSDLSHTPDYHGALGPLSLTIADFSSLPDHAGATTFEARFPQGGVLSWQGNISLDPLHSTGHLGFGDVRLVRPWEYFQENLAFEITDGILEAGIDYEFSLASGDLLFKVLDGSLAVRDLSLKGLSEETEILAIEALDVTGARYDLQQSSADIDEIRIAGGKLEGWLDTDGSLNLSEVFRPVNTAGGGTTSEAEPSWSEDLTASPDDTVSSPPEESKAVQLAIANISLEQFDIGIEDRRFEKPLRIDVQPLTIGVRNYHSQPGSPFDFDVKAELASGGSIGLSGKAAADGPTLDADIEITALSIMPVQPYVSQTTNLLLESGDLAVTGKLRSGQEETLSFAGRVSLSSLSSSDAIKKEKFLSWKDLTLENVGFELDKRNLSIGSVVATEPFGRIAIARDGRINIQDVFSSDQAIEADEKAIPETASPATDKEKAFNILVGQIRIDNGETDFSDMSLPLPFAARIHTMNGKVSAFSTEEGAPAGLDFEGTVNEFGSSSVKGKLDPFAPDRQADLNVAFQNVEMSSLTPYTAKFGGYRIDSGKLSLAVHYVVEDGQLNSGNRIIIDNLTLGDKVESPDAMNLPLKLAVALLKDSDGRIDLDLPVSGDVDDPEFHYGQVVVKVMGNVLKKLITAPFHFLARLVGAEGDDFQYVSFQPGVSDVPPPAQENLAKLAGAMDQRPQLSLALHGAWDPTLDGDAIQQRKLDDLVQQRLEKNMPRGDNPVRKTLESLFDGFYGAEARKALVSKHTSAPTTESGDKAKPTLDESAYVSELRARLEETQSATTDELTALGDARAEAIRQVLLADGSMTEDRVTLGTSKPVEAPEEMEVRMELSVAAD
jgi:hypothetical protein